MNPITATIVNLTSHPITVIVGNSNRAEGKTILIPPSGKLARVKKKSIRVALIEVDGVQIPINIPLCEQVSGLPDPSNGTFYVVSRMVAEAFPGRFDLLVPDEVIYDPGTRRAKFCQSFSVSNFSEGKRVERRRKLGRVKDYPFLRLSTAEEAAA